MRKIIIKDEIFKLFPDFYRGIIVVNGITNHPSLKRIRKLLKKAIDQQADASLENDAKLLAWDEAHRKFKSNPNKFPPSIKSLIKRVKKSPNLPYINSVVALFNFISLKYGFPCGGDDMAHVKGDLILGLADGTETFQPLGTKNEESPVKGEVIYFDSGTRNVMCRRWNWRNGETTRIESNTQQIVINLDCLPPTSPEQVIEARDELADLLKQHCDANLITDVLYADKRELSLNYNSSRWD